MANHESAKKAHRRSIKRNRINNDRKKPIRKLYRKVLLEIEEKRLDKLSLMFKEYKSRIMKAVSCKTLKLNYASRKVSQLNNKVKLALSEAK